MEFKFTDFAKCTDIEFSVIKSKTDSCAELNRSYELTGCCLPPGCSPSVVTLGFCRVAGNYLIYVRPETRYTGSNAFLRSILTPAPQVFPDFNALSSRLREAASSSSLPSSPRFRAAPADLFERLKNDLSAQILGQDEAVEAAAFKIYGHLSKRFPARPLSLIFYGPTGVGKSELGKALPAVLRKNFPAGDWRFVWTELNTFTEQHSVYRLTGAPPGYVGYDDAPIFEAVRHSPNTVFMFDELEKAHPQVLKVFMSILDEGRITAHKEDEKGSRELDFRHCIFIFTTNDDLSGTASHPLGFAPENKSHEPELPDGALPLSQRIFRDSENARRAMVDNGVLREIAGRFSGIIGFKPLDANAVFSVLKKQITTLAGEYGLTIISIDDNVVRELMTGASFSVRSNAGILEGALTPVFSEYATRCPSARVSLSMSKGAVTLSQTGAGFRLPSF